MAHVILEFPGYRCERCGHEWIARSLRNGPVEGRRGAKPRICPRCKSAWWEFSRDAESTDVLVMLDQAMKNGF